MIYSVHMHFCIFYSSVSFVSYQAFDTNMRLNET